MTKSRRSERTVYLVDGPFDGYELTIQGPAVLIWIPDGRTQHRYASTNLEADGLDVYKYEGPES